MEELYKSLRGWVDEFSYLRKGKCMLKHKIAAIKGRNHMILAV